MFLELQNDMILVALFWLVLRNKRPSTHLFPATFTELAPPPSAPTAAAANNARNATAPHKAINAALATPRQPTTKPSPKEKETRRAKSKVCPFF